MTEIERSPSPVGLELDRIFHRYGDTPVVDGVSLSIAPGELVALLGPSGCGKTTLLKIVAGFNHQTAGLVRIGGLGGAFDAHDVKPVGDIGRHGHVRE